MPRALSLLCAAAAHSQTLAAAVARTPRLCAAVGAVLDAAARGGGGGAAARLALTLLQLLAGASRSIADALVADGALPPTHATLGGALALAAALPPGRASPTARARRRRGRRRRRSQRRPSGCGGASARTRCGAPPLAAYSNSLLELLRRSAHAAPTDGDADGGVAAAATHRLAAAVWLLVDTLCHVPPAAALRVHPVNDGAVAAAFALAAPAAPDAKDFTLRRDAAEEDGEAMVAAEQVAPTVAAGLEAAAVEAGIAEGVAATLSDAARDAPLPGAVAAAAGERWALLSMFLPPALLTIRRPLPPAAANNGADDARAAAAARTAAALHFVASYAQALPKQPHHEPLAALEWSDGVATAELLPLAAASSGAVVAAAAELRGGVAPRWAVEVLLGWCRAVWELSRLHRGLLSRLVDGGGDGEALLWSIADALPAAAAAEASAGLKASAGRLGFFVLRLLEAVDSLRRRDGDADDAIADNGAADDGGRARSLVRLLLASLPRLGPGDETLARELISTLLLNARWLRRLRPAAAEGDDDGAEWCGALRSALLPSYLLLLELPKAAAALSAALAAPAPAEVSALRLHRSAAALPLAADWLVAPTHTFAVDRDGICRRRPDGSPTARVAAAAAPPPPARAAAAARAPPLPRPPDLRAAGDAVAPPRRRRLPRRPPRRVRRRRRRRARRRPRRRARPRRDDAREGGALRLRVRVVRRRHLHPVGAAAAAHRRAGGRPPRRVGHVGRDCPQAHRRAAARHAPRRLGGGRRRRRARHCRRRRRRGGRARGGGGRRALGASRLRAERGGRPPPRRAARLLPLRPRHPPPFRRRLWRRRALLGRLLADAPPAACVDLCTCATLEDACAAAARLGGGAAEVAAPLPPGRLELRLRALAAEEPEAVERVPGLAGVVGIV